MKKTLILLLIVDSCNVYRFIDDRRYRYFVTCPGGMTMGGYSTTTSNGKTSSTQYHPEEIPTTLSRKFPATLKKIKEGIYIDTAIYNPKYPIHQYNSNKTINP